MAQTSSGVQLGQSGCFTQCIIHACYIVSMRAFNLPIHFFGSQGENLSWVIDIATFYDGI